ncbi:MAG: hypothetical protein MJ209_04440 [archaeon]|nr:hypothetical protein [archaeon]
MFIKIRRDTLIILFLAFILILCGRLITYVAYASSTDTIDDGIPISGIIIKGNDVVPIDIIRANVKQSGLRLGSVIYGDILKTSKREVSLEDAISSAQKFATMSTIPGTTLTPISVADVQVDRSTGIVTVTVIEDFSSVELDNSGG